MNTLRFWAVSLGLGLAGGLGLLVVAHTFASVFDADPMPVGLTFGLLFAYLVPDAVRPVLEWARGDAPAEVFECPDCDLTILATGQSAESILGLRTLAQDHTLHEAGAR